MLRWVLLMEQAVAIQLLVIQTIASTEEILRNSSDRRERFSGGITNAGSLLGNAKLLIDLRNYNGEFKLPGNTYITGGRPYGQNTTLGTDESNTITLNIFTKTGVESLNGASIYGDGGTNAAYTKNGKITMNIQAAGSSIGNLYATQYSNISGGKILRDVTANVQGAVSINGLSGGSSTDNFTNAIVNASSNKVAFNFGTNVDGTNNYQTEPLNATGLGVVNFTELNVTNGIKLMANGGNIKMAFLLLPRTTVRLTMNSDQFIYLKTLELGSPTQPI